MKKKLSLILVILTALLLTLSLAACRENGGGSPSSIKTLESYFDLVRKNSNYTVDAEIGYGNDFKVLVNEDVAQINVDTNGQKGYERTYYVEQPLPDKSDVIVHTIDLGKWVAGTMTSNEFIASMTKVSYGKNIYLGTFLKTENYEYSAKTNSFIYNKDKLPPDATDICATIKDGCLYLDIDYRFELKNSGEVYSVIFAGFSFKFYDFGKTQFKRPSHLTEEKLLLSRYIRMLDNDNNMRVDMTTSDKTIGLSATVKMALDKEVYSLQIMGNTFYIKERKNLPSLIYVPDENGNYTTMEGSIDDILGTGEDVDFELPDFEDILDYDNYKYSEEEERYTLESRFYPKNSGICGIYMSVNKKAESLSLTVEYANDEGSVVYVVEMTFYDFGKVEITLPEVNG